MDVAKMEKQPVKLIKQLSGQSKSLEELPNNQTGQPDTRIHADRWQFCRQKRSWCGLTNTPGIPTLKFLKFVQRSPLTPPPPSSPPPCYDVVINMYCEHDMTFPVACFCEWISGLQKRLRKKNKKTGNTSGTESVRSSPPMIACQRWNDSTVIHWSTHICLKESMKRRSLWSADVSFYPIASWAERYLRAVCQGGWPEPVGHVSSWGICHGIWHNFMISTLSGGNSSGRLF